MKKLLCLFKHKWFYWKVDVNYRYCKRCGQWQKFEPFLAEAIDLWENCDKPGKGKIR